MKKIMLVFGTRPEAIKMCPLVIELKKRESIETIVCLTGQHKEMLDQVMDAFGIKSDYNLSIMSQGQTLGLVTTEILKRIDKIYAKENPDMVLVHGDTTTSFAAGLAAFYRKIPIGHVEAGLRTYDLDAPYPEEFNRQVVDLFSNLYFAPTEMARENLLREGKKENQIFVTGNTVIDALKTTIKEEYIDDNILWAKGSKLILLTTHRRENIGKPMQDIFKAVKRIVEEDNDVKVIYPIHKNPLVREIAYEYLTDNNNIRIIEPLDVFDFHNYMKKCYLVLTDSGGIQEEAPALGKPVLVLRNTTERPEGINAGTLKLIGTDEESIFNNTMELLKDNDLYLKMSNAINPYGDGYASKYIVDIILEYFLV